MPKPTPNKEQVSLHIRNKDWEELRGILSGCHPADIADVIERSPASAHEKLFALLEDDLKPDVLAELEGDAAEDVIEGLTSSELAEVVEDMSPDDAADVLADMTEKQSQEVLGLMDDEDSDDVRELLKHDPETAGGIMTTDVISMREDQSVHEALQAIAFEEHDENVFNAYVVDEDQLLIGYIDIWELLRSPDKKQILVTIVQRDFVSVTTDTDQEEVAHLIRRYDLSALPVVDFDGRLVGRITADDVIDVIADEASEDIMKMAGSAADELEHTSPLRSSLSRLPWLLVTMIGGFVTSIILREFQYYLAERAGTEPSIDMDLIALIPIVLAMAGNAGIQSSTLLVRSIALGSIHTRNVRDLFTREILTGSIMGLVCGAILSGWSLLTSTNELLTGGISGLELAGATGFSLFCAMTFATAFGAIVPLALNRARIDPALASGPFVIIANDVAALLIYFGILAALLASTGT